MLRYYLLIVIDIIDIKLMLNAPKLPKGALTQRQFTNDH